MHISKTWFLGVLGLSLAVLAVGVGWLALPLRLAQPTVSLEIESGQTPRAVAQAWVQAGVKTPAQALYVWFRLSGQATKIRAGSYEVRSGISPWTLLSLMVQGSHAYASLRLGEGWSLHQLRTQLSLSPGLTLSTATLSDADFLGAVGVDAGLADAAFFPDTYHYAKGSRDVDVLRRAAALMQRHLQVVWQARAPDLPVRTPEELVTLASMIEKETGVAGDRSRVAAVFANRLRLRMPLQSDPTVIYGMGLTYEGTLHHDDLLRDQPFNTYTRKGLPPTPIATVSLDSLQAAAHPAASAALYFVARGDGSSEFSDTLQAHNIAVNRYIKHHLTP